MPVATNHITFLQRIICLLLAVALLTTVVGMTNGWAQLLSDTTAQYSLPSNVAEEERPHDDIKLTKTGTALPLPSPGDFLRTERLRVPSDPIDLHELDILTPPPERLLFT